MSGPPTENDRNRDDHSRDRLTEIRDIGRARQQWLNELGVYTFSDLADASAEALAAQRQEADHSVNLVMIQQWIDQAKALAEEQDWERWNHNHEPLTDLEGIDAARQQWLYAVEIYTFAELANAAADDIASQMSEAGHTVTADEIQQWIDQSVAFVDNSPQTVQDVNEQDSETLDSESSEVNDSEPEPAAVSSSSGEQTADVLQDTDWTSLTSFSVSYQTCQVAGKTEARFQIQQAQTDVTQAWASDEIEQLPAWLLEQINALPKPVQEAPIVGKESAAEASVHIEQIRFLQSPQTQYVVSSGQLSKMIGPIQSGRSFVSEVSLSLMAVNELATSEKELALQLQAFILNRITGDSFSITSSHSVLTPQVQTTLTVNLPETILEMGIYRFRLVVSTIETISTPNLFEVPALQVI
ncbi:MAG: hypothetical protein AAGI69_23670 [Cyanobacteria bacterium P01_H01_bin.21]